MPLLIIKYENSRTFHLLQGLSLPLLALLLLSNKNDKFKFSDSGWVTDQPKSLL
jgi:hypothetical protein